MAFTTMTGENNARQFPFFSVTNLMFAPNEKMLLNKKGQYSLPFMNGYALTRY